MGSTTNIKTRAAKKQAIENRRALGETRALKRAYEPSEKFDVVVPLYDLKGAYLTPSGKWIKPPK